MTPIDLIGKIGRRMRMAPLLSRTSVQTRLNSPAGMSFAEFSYQLFQAYDWYYLFNKFDCKFQVIFFQLNVSFLFIYFSIMIFR